MRTIKGLILLILVIGIFQANLFSLISSRIEGKILDGGTGDPISGATVALFKCGTVLEDFSHQIASQKSSSTGYFKFDNLKTGEYALLIFKEGYSPTVPIDILKSYLSTDVSPELKSTDLKPFYLKEGEVKHLRFNLKAEAVLNVRVSKKYPDKDALVDQEVTMFIEEKKSNHEIGEIFEGTYRSKYLEEGFYKLTIYVTGFPEKVYDNVELKRDIATDIHCVFDLTKGQVVHGAVSDKATGMRLPYTEILVEKVDDDFSARTVANEFGKFRIGGLTPGTYFLQVDMTIFKREVNYKTTFKINENEQKELNVVIDGGYK